MTIYTLSSSEKEQVQKKPDPAVLTALARLIYFQKDGNYFFFAFFAFFAFLQAFFLASFFLHSFFLQAFFSTFFLAAFFLSFFLSSFLAMLNSLNVTC